MVTVRNLMHCCVYGKGFCRLLQQPVPAGKDQGCRAGETGQAEIMLGHGRGDTGETEG